MRTLAPLLLLLALTGCSRDIRNEQAVRQGVIDYLSSRPGLSISSMNVQVTSVIFRKDEAEANVSFSPKGSSAAGAGMTIRYLLELKGGKWVVRPRADSGKSPHAGADSNPHGATMPAPEGASPAGTLPPGHPAVPPKDSGH